MDVSTVKVPDITPEKLEGLREDVHARKALLMQAIRALEARYQCSLADLEQKLESAEIEEHPAWEDSIEWRKALEQLDRIKLSD